MCVCARKAMKRRWRRRRRCVKLAPIIVTDDRRHKQNGVSPLGLSVLPVGPSRRIPLLDRQAEQTNESASLLRRGGREGGTKGGSEVSVGVCVCVRAFAAVLLPIAPAR